MSDFSLVSYRIYAEKIHFTSKMEMLKELESQQATETKFRIISFTLTAIRHHSNDILSHIVPSMNQTIICYSLQRSPVPICDCLFVIMNLESLFLCEMDLLER